MRFLLSLLLMPVLLAACNEELSVEQQVIATLRNMEYAAEQGEHFEFMGYLTDPFSAQHGTMNRREFHRFMIFQINQNRRLQAQFFPIYVQEAGIEKATAQFKILVTGGGGLLPERGQLFAVETSWQRSGGDWLLAEANWEAVRLPDE